MFSFRPEPFIDYSHSFLVNFSIPYLLDTKYAGLDSKVGFIFGSIAFAAFTCTFLFVPECKGKTLEQVDLLFNSDVPLRHFGKTDAGAMMLVATGTQKAAIQEADDAEQETGRHFERATMVHQER